MGLTTARNSWVFPPVEMGSGTPERKQRLLEIADRLNWVRLRYRPPLRGAIRQPPD
ncbi:MAG: hypothetical protein MUC60_11310 [Oscillatoria sp. Prado101]|nr:hypothetical protein [Oscillatoria sp. Prado101]